jgi:MFS family permease
VFAAALYLPVTTVADVESEWLGSFTLTVPLLVLFAARALDGLTGGNVSVANAYLADITPDEQRGRNFGRMGMSSNLGFILGPALASVLGTLGRGEIAPVMAALVISAVATLLIAFLLPESRPSGIPPRRRGVRRTSGLEPVDCTRVPESRRAGLNAVLRRASVRRVLLLHFLIFLGFSLFYVGFPVRAASDLQWSVGITGIFFAFLSLLMVIVQGPVLTRLSGRVPETLLIVAGNLLLAINFLMLTSSHTAVVFGAAVLFALGNGIMWPTIQAVLSKVADPELQGATQGFAGAAGSLASILGLLGGGVMYEWLGARIFAIAGALMVLVALLARRWCRLR